MSPESDPVHLQLVPSGGLAAHAAAALPRALPHALRFGRFELQPGERRLLADGEPVAMRARAFDVLIVLVERAGQLVGRGELLDRVWYGLVVEENNLSVQINALRKVLGGEIVATVPGRGYRFTAPVDAAPSPDGPRVASATMAPARPAQRTNLPEAMAALIGRQSEFDVLGALVDQHRLVSVIGAAGVGKTRLTQALLHARRKRYQHGVCMVDLMPLTAADSVPHAVAAALGLPQSGDGEPLAALLRSMAPLQMLVALDNAEHVIGAVASFAAALVAAAPQVRLLVTSQVPLKLAEEHRFRLDGLAVPDDVPSAALAQDVGAVALFVARAQAADPRFVLHDGNVAEVVALCRRLHGSALAIELAAARLELLGLPGLLNALTEPLRVLTEGSPGAPSRHRSLRAALSWSHGLLNSAEQTVFRRFSVFVGSASLAMVQQVLADDAGLDAWAVLDALGALVERSLVQLNDGPGDAPRYSLLATPLALARELSAAAGDTEALQRRHAQAVCAYFEQAHDDLLAGRVGEDQFMQALAPDIDNAHAACRWALAHDEETAQAIAAVLSLALGPNRHAERTALWATFEPLLASAQPRRPGRLARAMLYCADSWRNTRTAHARGLAERAREVSLAEGDGRAALLALKIIAATCWRMGDRAALQAAVDGEWQIGRATSSAYVRAAGTTGRAWLCGLDGDHEGALQAWQEQVELCRAAGISDASALNNIAGIYLAAGRSAEAAEASRALAARLAGTRDRVQLFHALSNWSAALLSQDDAAAARPVLVDSWPLALQYEMLPQWADDAALVAAIEGRAGVALRLLGYADAAFAAFGQPREAVDQMRADRAERIARNHLQATHDEAALQRLRTEGSMLGEDELRSLALGARSI